MKMLGLTILALLLIAGCKQADYSGAVFEFHTYGGFTMAENNRNELIVEPTKITLRILAANGSLTSQIERPIEKVRYDRVANAFRENRFFELKDRYTPSGGVQIADAATADLIIRVNGQEKKVTMDPFVPEFYPTSLQSISTEFMGLVDFALESNGERIAAEQFVIGAPTFLFDGSGLSLVEHIQRESYPVQHVFTFKFTSSHQGYGNRDGKIVAEVITEHEIDVTVVDGKITSAVIDNVWDELNQKDVNSPINPEEPVSNESFGSDAWLTYTLMQCDKTPWQQWYENGSVQFIGEPTDEELAIQYFSQVHQIKVLDFEKKQEKIIACQACGVCPTGTSYRAAVDGPFREQMMSMNWTV